MLHAGRVLRVRFRRFLRNLLRGFLLHLLLCLLRGFLLGDLLGGGLGGIVQRRRRNGVVLIALEDSQIDRPNRARAMHPGNLRVERGKTGARFLPLRQRGYREYLHRSPDGPPGRPVKRGDDGRVPHLAGWLLPLFLLCFRFFRLFLLLRLLLLLFFLLPRLLIFIRFLPFGPGFFGLLSGRLSLLLPLLGRLLALGLFPFIPLSLFPLSFVFALSAFAFLVLLRCLGRLLALGLFPFALPFIPLTLAVTLAFPGLPCLFPGFVQGPTRVTQLLRRFIGVLLRLLRLIGILPR